MRLDEIFCYQSNADIHCPNCIRTMAAFALAGEGEAAFMGRPTDGDTTEQFLDRWAAQEGIDRADEHTFDAEDFPKPVLGQQYDPQALWVCGTCFTILDED